MNRIYFLIIAVLICACEGFSINRGPARDPISRGTVPASAVESGLVRSPDPLRDYSGNLYITGNVTGNKFFRGVVPYNSPYSFQGNLGGSDVENFMRYSAPTGDLGPYTDRPVPYYSERSTVSKFVPGTRGEVYRPAPDYSKNMYSGYALPPLQQGQAPDDMRLPELQYRPMAMSQQEMERMMTNQIKIYSQAKTQADEEYRKEVERLREELQQVEERAEELKQKFDTDEKTELIPSVKPEKTDRMQPFELQKPQITQKPGEELVKEERRLDVYEQMQLQMKNFKKTREKLTEQDIAAQKKLEAEKPESEKRESEEEPKQEGEKEPMEEDKLLEVGKSVAEAQAVLGEHKTFAGYSKDKFNLHMRAGEIYMKDGKYYLAASAYSLASIYKPNDPLPYAGKSHALFAAGEYMSSAWHLATAIEIFPDYPRFKVDLEKMIGSRDKLESRIADVEDWQKKGQSPELQFLLGYLYYQMDRIDPAKKAIDAAYEKMPGSPAVIVLKDVIDTAAGSAGQAK